MAMILARVIQSKAHWDVAIRPYSFRDDRVDYGRLEEILEVSAVRFRGWPVPFVDTSDVTQRWQDSVGQEIDTLYHQEAWRFFTSGQFLQLRVISADTEGDSRSKNSSIEVWEILFYLTELVELAARLALSEAGDSRMAIDIALKGMASRRLVSGDAGRMLAGNFVSQLPTISHRRVEDRDRLVSSPREIAVSMSQEIIRRFGCTLSNEVLSDHQLELTKGR